MSNTLFNQTGTGIKVNLGGSGAIAGQSPNASNTVTISTTAAIKRRLRELEDVNDNTVVDGGTLVYDATSETYVLRALSLDGGTF